MGASKLELGRSLDTPPVNEGFLAVADMGLADVFSAVYDALLSLPAAIGAIVGIFLADCSGDAADSEKLTDPFEAFAGFL